VRDFIVTAAQLGVVFIAASGIGALCVRRCDSRRENYSSYATRLKPEI
jgi:hypothetical protein